MDAVWPDAFVTEASLLEAIGVLRDALGDDRLNPTYIQTVHRRGYRFIAPIAPARSAPGTAGTVGTDAPVAPSHLSHLSHLRTAGTRAPGTCRT